MMPSSMPSDALPVRRVANSFRSASRALFIFSSAFFFCSLSIAPPGYERPDTFAHYDLFNIARDGEVEYKDRKIIVFAQGDSGSIHDTEILLEDIEIRKTVKLRCGLILQGIGAVYAIDLGRFHDDLGTDFHGP